MSFIMFCLPLALYAISSCGVLADAASDTSSSLEVQSVLGPFIKLASEPNQPLSMPVSETSNAMRFAIEYPQSEVELPNVGTLTKLYDQPTAHHRIPKSALSSTFASLTQPISSLGPKESTDSGIDVIVEITLHAKNRRALQSPLVITLDPLIMADSETTATAASESPISSISSSDITIWNLATPTSGDLVSTPTAIVPMSTATISQHYLHHGDRAHRHRRSTTTYVLPADEANQLSSHQAHKAKLEHLGQATPSV